MEMTLRWYGKTLDSVTLKQIRQIPGVTGVISALHQLPAGEAWPYEEVIRLQEEVKAAGLNLSGIESINIHEDIKLGKPTRDQYIDHYITSLKHIGQAGIHLVCYNFMPVFDWTRTNLALQLPDGSYALSYDSAVIDSIRPQDMFTRMEEASQGFVLPGWEPNRKEEIKQLFFEYEGVTAEDLRANYKYFLDAIMPTCEKYQIKMAVHPDDPAWPVFGLPRIVTCKEDLLRIIAMNPSIYNGFTFCTGSLGSNVTNDLTAMIREPEIAKRIHFAHLRNIKFEADRVFHESAHLSSEGSFDMYAIVKALIEAGFDGVIRPDHGRMIWEEQARPGYGLYDRALGACYLNGLIEACKKERMQ